MQSTQELHHTKQKALGISIVAYTAIVVLLFLLQWTTPENPPDVLEEGIEVNLGNSETGLGDEVPMVPGPPAPDQELNASPPPSNTGGVQETADVDTDDSDVDAPAVVKPNKPSATKVIKDKPTVTNNNTKPKTETATPVPAKPKPKALYGGGAPGGTGGNNADSYNNVRNQGIAGGTGDQGKPNGNPNSDSYTGNGGTGKSGVNIRLAGRRLMNRVSFEDDFNENGKVAVDIRVDREGKVVSATYQPRGSTTSNAKMKQIAIDKAKKLKFDANDNAAEEQIGTVVFNFVVQG